MAKGDQREIRFRQCAGEFYPMLWRLSGAYASGSDRDDLVQEMLVAIWKKLPQFEARSKLSTWSWKVAFYTAMNWKRKQGRRLQAEPLEHDLSTSLTDNPAADKLELVYRALRKLPELDRSVLLMALEEIPRKEMADSLGIRENAVQVRLHRARRRLNEEMERMES